jgi:hypothetical protein
MWMGAFLGSTQVKSGDRKAVLAAATAVAKELDIQCLVSPVVSGWVGVFPSNNGQDQRVGEELAKRLGGTVWHVLVHDDDVLAYWLWHEQELVDSYCSVPGYFGEEDQAEQEAMTGNPTVLSQFVGGDPAKLAEVLARDGEHPLAQMQLDELGRITGVPNLTHAYEYLKEEETQGVRGWSRFKEIPADRVQSKAQQTRALKKQLADERKRLQQEGQLLYFEERTEGTMGLAYACAMNEGFLVAWSNYGRGVLSFAIHASPWDTPRPLTLETPGDVRAVVSDASRTRFAVAGGSRVRAWDVDAGQWKLVADIPETDLALSVALSADGKRIAHSSRLETLVREVPGLRVIASCDGVSCEPLAFHPDGDWLVGGSNRFGLIAVRENPHWRPLYVGGISQPLPHVAALFQEVQEQFRKIDVDEFMKQARAQMEAMTKQFGEAAGRSNQGVDAEEMIEKMRRQMEQSLAEQKDRLQAMQEGSPRVMPTQAVERVSTAGFSRDGRWLWCGTERGLRVYDWASVPRDAGSELRDPHWKYTETFTYAVAEEVDAAGLVFGGISGTLYRLDLTTGQTRELLKLPGDVSIYLLTMSADGQSLGISTRTRPNSKARRKGEKWGWQIWSYPQLRGPLLSTAD